MVFNSLYLENEHGDHQLFWLKGKSWSLLHDKKHIGRDRSSTCIFCVYILQKKHENFLALGTNFTKHHAQDNLKRIREYLESKVKEN